MTQEQFLNRLQDLYKKNVEISRAKNKDYAGELDPFKNFRMCEQLGICSTEVGMMVRITDKISRLSTLITKKDNAVKDESIDDTLADLANYSTILRVYLEEKNGTF